MAGHIAKAAFVFAVLLLAEVASAQGTRGYLATLRASPVHKLMVQMIQSNPTYSRLLGSTNLPFTVFAPTDAAFNAAAKKYGISPAAAMKNPALLQAMLMYHVVPGTPVTGSTLRNGKRYLRTMYKGMSLYVTNGKDKVTGQPVTWVNSAGPGVRVTKFDQLVANTVTGRTVGVIHDINGILMFDKDPAKILAIK